jgi:hypothetical protein
MPDDSCPWPDIPFLRLLAVVGPYKSISAYHLSGAVLDVEREFALLIVRYSKHELLDTLLQGLPWV